MVPDIFEIGIITYEVIKLIAAAIALILAVSWKRTNFLAGLFFLFLYSFFNVVYFSFSTLLDRSMLDVSQFGFILLAIISFIIGMWQSMKEKAGTERRYSMLR